MESASEDEVEFECSSNAASTTKGGTSTSMAESNCLSIGEVVTLQVSINLSNLK